MKKLYMILWLIGILIFCFYPPVHTSQNQQELDGVLFDTVIHVNNEPLKLKGIATLNYLIFIKAYTGGLYLPESVPLENVLSDVPKQLELEYFHPISGKDFYDATEELIQKNTTPEVFGQIKGELELLSRTYKDVEPQDRYAITYWPGHGTDLALNGNVLETFKGADFAKAMFSIWLGEEPISEDFRDKLTGRK